MTRISHTSSHDQDRLLFDGMEPQVFEELFVIKLPDGEISLKLPEVLNKDLAEWNNNVPPKLLQWAEEIGFEKRSGRFYGSKNLGLYYHFPPGAGQLLILAFGEVQPARYLVFLEGIFAIGE